MKKPLVSSSADYLLSLSLVVVSSAGFSKSFKFEGHDERKRTCLSGNYKNSLSMYISHAVRLVTSTIVQNQPFTSFST